MTGTLKMPPKQAEEKCRSRGGQALCQWPRCKCPIDIVYTTDIHIQRQPKGKP